MCTHLIGNPSEATAFPVCYTSKHGGTRHISMRRSSISCLLRNKAHFQAWKGVVRHFVPLSCPGRVKQTAFPSLKGIQISQKPKKSANSLGLLQQWHCYSSSGIRRPTHPAISEASRAVNCSMLKPKLAKVIWKMEEMPLKSHVAIGGLQRNPKSLTLNPETPKP